MCLCLIIRTRRTLRTNQADFDKRQASRIEFIILIELLPPQCSSQNGLRQWNGTTAQSAVEQLRRYLRRQLREFRLIRTFRVRVCSGDTENKKPHPEPLLCALEGMSLSPEDSVYVGDTREDVLMARRAGVRTVGIVGPFPTAKRLKLSRPDVLLSSLLELPAALRRLAK